MTENVIGLPIPETEPYVSRAELARLMGVHIKTIDQFVREGMPSETWGMKRRMFQPSRAIAWARSRRRAA